MAPTVRPWTSTSPRLGREDASKVRFSDVAGCDEEKAEMVEMVEYLKDPKKYSKFGARLPKGVSLSAILAPAKPC
jgi:ATP-dependent Zn protease